MMYVVDVYTHSRAPATSSRATTSSFRRIGRPLPLPSNDEDQRSRPRRERRTHDEPGSRPPPAAARLSRKSRPNRWDRYMAYMEPASPSPNTTEHATKPTGFSAIVP